MELAKIAHPTSPLEHAVPEKTFGIGTRIGRVNVGASIESSAGNPEGSLF